MQLREESLAVLAIALILLLALPFLFNTLSDDLIQAAQLAIALASIFLGAHFELQNLMLKLEEERKNLALKLEEERKKEIRHEKLKSLDYIESWLDEAASTIEEIIVRKEFSSKEDESGQRQISARELAPFKEELLRLEIRGYTAVARLQLVDVDERLTDQVSLVWASLSQCRKALLQNRALLPPEPIATAIAKARRTLDNIRIAKLEEN
jgi:hypothetical protein